MALLSFRGISTPSLQAQGEQRRSSYFNNDRDIAQKLSRVHSPQEFADVVTNHVRDQIESLTEQIEEFSALTQKAPSKNEEETQPGWGE